MYGYILITSANDERNETLLFKNGCDTVEELLRMNGRPMTIREISMVCNRNRQSVYKQIQSGIANGALREFRLDFLPFYKREVRLIGLVVEPFKAEFVTE